jgi:hypothetical protein
MPSYQVRATIKELKSLSLGTYFIPGALLLSSVIHTGWQIFVEGNSFESLRYDMPSQTLGIISLVSIIVAGATQTIIRGQIALAQLQLMRSEQAEAD